MQAGSAAEVILTNEVAIAPPYCCRSRIAQRLTPPSSALSLNQRQRLDRFIQYSSRAESPVLRVQRMKAEVPIPAPIGGYSRGCYLPVDHALRSEPGADVQARRRRECRRGFSWPPEAGFALPAFPSLPAGAQRPRHTPSRHAVRSRRLPGAAGQLGRCARITRLFAIADPRRTGHCGTERSCVRAFTIDRPRFVTAGDPPARLGGKPVPGGQARGGSCGQHRESPRPPTGKGGRAPGDGPGGSARSRPR